MNKVDRERMMDIKTNYPDFFKNKKILELGSHDINGTTWDMFDDCEMTGVDWMPGHCVTHVMKCHETNFERDTFDMIISLNHLEHDPYWEESISHNWDSLKNGGLFYLRWADEGTAPHSIHSDPSGKVGYYPKKLNDVLFFLARNFQIKILSSASENNPSLGGNMSEILLLKK